MEDLKAFVGRKLQWLQPSPFKREYELRGGAEVLATLRWHKPSGSLALAESLEGSWTFKRSGFLSPQVTVRVAGAEANLAVFTPGWRGEGLLAFSNRHEFHWVNTEFWGSEWAFTDPFGGTLVHLRPVLPPAEQPPEVRPVRAADVKIETAAGAVPQLSILTILGWYLLVLMAEDAAVLTGAV